MKRSIVIDANATGCWLLNDEDSHYSEKIFSDVITGKTRLIQPLLWPYEIVNLLLNAVYVNKRIKEEEGKRLLFLWSEVPVNYEERGKHSDFEILSCALQRQLTSYEAAYFNLAEKQGVELFTEDEDLLKLKAKCTWIKRLREYDS